MNYRLISILVISFISIYIFLKPESYDIKNSNPQGEGIVCFGDSLTQGIGAKEGLDYPSQLSILINLPVHNLGISGNTTAQALARIDDVLLLNPKFVLITLGGNDLKNGVKKEHAFKNLYEIIQKIQDKGSLVILGGIKIPLFDKGYADSYQTLAKKTGVILIPNILDGLFGHPNLMSDSIHPNSDGYAIMANAFYEKLLPYL